VSEGRTRRFRNRHDAGRRLAARLLPLAAERPVVVGLPRGGVPVAEEIAVALDAVLEVFAVRKVGAPHNPEYGIGAIAEDGTWIVDRGALAALEIDDDTLAEILARERAELRRRVETYRGDRAALSLRGRSVIVVDDGVATGVTDTAALRALRRLDPRRLVLAVPVCPPDSAARLRAEADELVCLVEPEQLYGVGQWYADFTQVTDAEVLASLRSAGPGAPGKAAADRWFPADGARPDRS
jgi:putative phosphoribosyl transferase